MKLVSVQKKQSEVPCGTFPTFATEMTGEHLDEGPCGTFATERTGEHLESELETTTV